MAFPNRVLPTIVGNGGFTGKTLRVDLTTRTWVAEPTLGVWSNGNTPFVAGSGTDHSKFWGGNGQAYKVLWDEVPNSVKWYDPGNRIMFGWGPMGGSGAPSSGRTSITSLGPVNCAPGSTINGQTINCTPSTNVLDGYMVGAVVNGHMGGHFSAECKYAGWDGIVVQGKASGPVYIAIRDNDVQIVDCPQLWGCGIFRTTVEISQAMGPGCHVAAIGQAGQNLVPESVVMCDKSHGAGAGMGAVLGSKNCVGIGALGTGTVKIACGKTKWRMLIENAVRIQGSCYNACGPNAPQAWAEYWSSGVRWYAKKGQYWGAANPPVETGACDPHETDAAGNPTWRQNMGYRSFKSDPGVYGEKFTVRMDGCNACPVRCHQMINVPSASKWDTPDTYATNTCSGWWAATSIMDTSKFTVAMATAGDVAMTKLEQYVVGHNVQDDYGLWCNYQAWAGYFNYLMGDGTAPIIKKNVLGNTMNVLGTSVDEWNYLTKGSALGDSTKAGYSATGTNNDTALAGFITLRQSGDLRAIRECCRLMARIGTPTKLGLALGQQTEWILGNWTEVDGVTPLRAGFLASSNSTSYWGFGGAWHHGDYETGMLLNIGYNTHPQNHTWGPITQGGSPWPDGVRIPIVEDVFVKLGYGKGMGLSSDYTTLMCQEKARAARFSQSQKDMCDSTGLCNWTYPFTYSPLKERGYRGDLTLPCQYFNALTGSNLTPYQFELESERFFVLQCCLTLKRFGNINRRAFHDTAGAGGRGQQGTPGANNRLTQWNTAGGVLESYYKEMRWDIATGAPTVESLAALGLDAAHGTDVAGYFSGAGMPLPHLPASDPLLPYPAGADADF